MRPLNPLWIAAPLVLAPGPGFATWPADPTVNVPVCTAAGNQERVSITPDGAGGAILVWSDLRSGVADIYARRVDGDGNAVWAPDGVLICGAAGAQTVPDIAPDGYSGAVITWQDERGADADIYVQRVDATGTALWTADGVALCTASGAQLAPVLISDAIHGAFVAWGDNRNGDADVYIEHVDSTGTALLYPDGLPICADDGSQSAIDLAPNGSGGVYITWQDDRDQDNEWDIYAQLIDGFNAVSWTVGGHSVCSETGSQQAPRVVSDFAGGAIITWADYRNGNTDVYAQHMSMFGYRTWASAGVAVCTDAAGQSSPSIAPDNSGGAIIGWTDLRGPNPADVYAQRLDGDGTSLWAADGVVVSDEAGGQTNPRVVQDGGGGAFVVWSDTRSGLLDIYGQHMNGSGVPQWTAGGEPICSNASYQFFPDACYNGSNAAIVAWQDDRNSFLVWDVYAGRLTNGAVVSAPVTVTREPVIAVWPNPFRSSATIGFDLSRGGAATLSILDVTGRRLRVWEEDLSAGAHRLSWDGRDQACRRVVSGVYLAQLQIGGVVRTTRMTLVR